jgi:hypothetical protein
MQFITRSRMFASIASAGRSCFNLLLEHFGLAEGVLCDVAPHPEQGSSQIAVKLAAMKLIYVCSVTAAVMFTGCASTSPTRIVANTVGAVGGAVLGNALGKGNPLMTVAGAGAGVLLGETLQAGSTRAHEKSYAAGYEKGRSDSAKQRYQFLLEQQREPSGEDNGVSLLEIPLPEREVGGVRLNAETAVLRIQE